MLANVHVHHDHQTGRKHANLKGAWGKRRHLSTPFCFQRKRRLNMIGEPVRNSFGSCWVGNSLCFWTTYATYPPILGFGSLTKCTQSRSIPEWFHYQLPICQNLRPSNHLVGWKWSNNPVQSIDLPIPCCPWC